MPSVLQATSGSGRDVPEVPPCIGCHTTGGVTWGWPRRPRRWRGLCMSCKREALAERCGPPVPVVALAPAPGPMVDRRAGCRASAVHQGLPVLDGRWSLDDLTPRALCRVIRRGMRRAPAPGISRLLTSEVTWQLVGARQRVL